MSKENENTNLKRYNNLNVHSSIIYNSQNMEVTQVTIDRWMDKEDVVYIHNGILLSNKKEWNSDICSNMDGLGGHYAKWDKSDGKRQILYDIIWMWNLKSTTNEEM